ncbi:MAG: sulfatase-like hydrolase/transferase [Planctomycetota bacterium]
MSTGRAVTLVRCALLASLACACSGGEERLSVLLVTMDTTRPESITPFERGARGVTPNLAALARESVLYERAYATAPITLPAHTSMMTGLYPVRHTVRDNGMVVVPPSADTLAERARAAGYQTGAVVAAVVLDRAWGLDQGFETYDGPPPDPEQARLHIPDRSAADVARTAKSWLQARDKSRPFFLWVHFFDPHAPYEPPPEFLAQAGGHPYLGEVAAMDREIGGLLELLRSDGALDDTLVMAIADHGESLGQHGEQTHAVFCYDATMRIPLIVRHPDGWRRGEVTHEIASSVDVFPTLAEAMQLDVPAGIDGRSLFRSTVDADRGVYFESYYPFLNFGWSPLVGYVDAHGKLIQGNAPELYRTNTDFVEKEDVAAQHPGDVERYRSKIAAIARRPALVRDPSSRVDESVVAQVQGLGYAGAADPDAELPAPLDPTDRMDPRTRLVELEQYRLATEIGPRGEPEKAIEMLQEIVADNPRNVSALDHLGSHFTELARCTEAEAVIVRLREQGSEQAKRYTGVGRCYEKAGDFARAVVMFQRAVELTGGGAAQTQELERARAKLPR